VKTKPRGKKPLRERTIARRPPQATNHTKGSTVPPRRLVPLEKNEKARKIPDRFPPKRPYRTYSKEERGRPNPLFDRKIQTNRREISREKASLSSGREAGSPSYREGKETFFPNYEDGPKRKESVLKEPTKGHPHHRQPTPAHTAPQGGCLTGKC